jgi:hypothetical protein
LAAACQISETQRHHQNLDEKIFRCANLPTTNSGSAVGTSGSSFGVTTISNYKGAVVWDNKFILAYGLKLKGDNRTAKTDDRLELNSLWGKSKR